MQVQSSIRARRRPFRTALIVALVMHSQAVGAAADGVAANPDAVSIENGLVRAGFDQHDGALIELVDLQTRHNHVGESTGLGGLWMLAGSLDGRAVVLTSAEAKSFRWEAVASEQPALRLTWSDFALPGASDTKVEVDVRPVDGASLCQLQIRVDKPVGLGLHRIHFPRVGGLHEQEDERLAVPVWMGELAANPRSLLTGPEGAARRLSWDYPGSLSMQCLAYYRNKGPGFYAACDDTASARKTFAVWGSAGRQLHFETVHYPEGYAGGAIQYSLPYQVLLGTFQGDWITAAERYRAWGARQPWAAESRLRRNLVEDWVLETGLWVWNRGRSPGVLPPAVALQERLGLPVRVFWHWWHGCPYDIGFPEYFPPREGNESFEQAVTRAHEKGLRMLIYMNQRAWGMSTRSWQEEGAERFAVKEPDGKVRPEVYNTFTGQALASMCLATPFWRDKYAALAEQAFVELGVDGIYMDQACSHRACYDPRHGHPLGGGNSWTEGFRQLVGDIRSRSDADRRIVLAGEGCGEAWLAHLDLMLTLQVSKERYSRPNDGWDVIPFFQAVYHPFAVTFGSYSSLTMPPYDDLWPAEHAPAEPLALLDPKYSRQFYLEQARAFVWGQQPTLANFLPEHFEDRPDEIEFVMRLARVRSAGAKYLLHGEFLRPPEAQVPEVVSDFSRLSIYAGQFDRLTSYRKRHPLALLGAWRAPNGDVGIALASIADETLTLSIELDPADYGVEERTSVYRIDEEGRRPYGQYVGDSLKLDLPARQAWILEFCAT